MALQVPYLFQAGTPAEAEKVNANFDAVEAWANSGGIETQSIATLTARANGPILSLDQTVDFEVIQITNDQGNSVIDITQLEALDADKAVIKIDASDEPMTQGSIIDLLLNVNSTIPAIKVRYGGTTVFQVTKQSVQIPKIAAANRNDNPIPAEGSILYNTTTKQLNEKKSHGWAPIGAPVGSVMMFVGNSAPEGWLLCNGDVVPNGVGTVQGIQADFTALYSVLNAQYGVPKAAGKLPDLRGAFVRGTGTNAHSPESISQTGPALGDWQNDQTAVNGLVGQVGNPDRSLDHRHQIWVNDPDDGHFGAPEESTDSVELSAYVWPDDLANLNEHKHSFNLTGNNETRPFSIGLNYIIKY